MPEMKKAIVASSNEARKAKTPPAVTPGRMFGRTMLKKARERLAPQLSAASSRLTSKRCSAADTVMTT